MNHQIFEEKTESVKRIDFSFLNPPLLIISKKRIVRRGSMSVPDDDAWVPHPECLVTK